MGSKAVNTSVAVEDTKNTKEMPVVGLAGQRMHVGFLPQYEDANDPRNRIAPGGRPGPYKVVFTLSSPAYPLLPEGRFSAAEHLKGASYLAITEPAISDPLVPNANAIVIGFDIPNVGNVEFKGYPNDEGYLGKIEIDNLESGNFPDAEEKAYYLLAPVLSYFSTYLDIPLYVYQVDVTEVGTGSVLISMTNPFRDAPYAIVPEIVINNEWRGYASLYREALNTNSNAYQFLCLFKIIEGIRERHNRLAVEARSKGQPFTRLAVVIPDTIEEETTWLNEIFPIPNKWDEFTLASIFLVESKGKRLGNLIERHLNPLRVDIAHALFSPGGELTISIDEAFHNPRLTKWIPLLKCIVRRMLKNEFPVEFSFKAARPIEIANPLRPEGSN